MQSNGGSRRLGESARLPRDQDLLGQWTVRLSAITISDADARPKAMRRPKRSTLLTLGSHSRSVSCINARNPEVVSTAGRHPNPIKADGSATDGPATRL